MGIRHLFRILGQYVKSHNPGAFCHDWYEKHNRPANIGIDASAIIHPLLRRHKHLLLLGAKDGSDIGTCKPFYDDMKKNLLDMKAWTGGKVILKIVCDGKRLSMKLANAERERLREAAFDRLPSQKIDSESEKHDPVDASATSDEAVAIGAFGPQTQISSKTNHLGFHFTTTT